MRWARCVAVLIVAQLFAFSALAGAKTKPAKPKGPDLRSTSVMVFDESHAAVLFEKKADIAVPIASITKLMTALVVLEARQSLQQTIEVTDEDRSHGKGAYSRLAVGTKLTREELLRLALMSSENRAAHALGRRYPRGVPACVAAMNTKAKALGMKTAHFVDPAGLSSQNVASAADLAKLVRAAAHSPAIREYSTGKDYTVRVGRNRLIFHNTNALVGRPNWDIVVQKTGYIAEAGRCLVMQTVFEDRKVVIVLLNSYGKYTRVADVRRIRRWLESGISSHATAAVAHF